MSDWMAAADAMIHATAGLTVLEAHIRGCPVISYGFSAGHLRANNAAFERFGIAEVARSDHELESTLRHVAGERRSPDSSFASLPSIASRALVGAAAGAPGAGLAPAHRRAPSRSPALAIIAVVLVISAVAPREPAEAAREPVTSRIHIGNDNDSDGDPGGEEARPDRQLAPAATETVEAEANPSVGVSRRRRRRGRAVAGPRVARRRRRARPRGGGPARRPGAGADRAPRSAGGSASILRDEGNPGVALTFDDGPHPQGTPAVLEILREAGRDGDLLPRRRAGREAARAGGRDRRRRPPGRAPLPSPPQPAAADAAGRCSTTPSGRRAAIEEASGQAIADYRPPYGIFSGAGLRAIRSRGWRPVLWSQWGTRLDEAGDARRRSRARRPPGSAPGTSLLLHDADFYSARELLGAHRVSAAEDPRRARRRGA